MCQSTRLLKLDCQLLRNAVTKCSTDLAKRACRSVMAHLPPSDAIQALSQALSCGAASFSEHVPILSHVYDVAVNLPRLDRSTLLLEQDNEEFEKRRYYMPVTLFLSAFRQALYAAEEVLDSGDAVDHSTTALVDLMDALEQMAWAFSCPDEYTAWWASALWAEQNEGPAPPGVCEITRNHETFTPVARALEAILTWLETNSELKGRSTN